MKRCPICDELIEEHLQVCPYCDEETGFEAETISKKACPVCGELIDETLLVCPVCGEDISPQTNSEHAPESVLEELEPVREPEPETIRKKACPVCGELIDEALIVCPICGEDITPQTSSDQAPEVAEEPVVILQPTLEVEPEPIVEEPQPVQEPEQEPEPEVAQEPVVIPQPEPVLESQPIVEEPQPMQESVQEPEPEITPEPVVIPQPEPEATPEPIVEEPQPMQEPEQAPEPETTHKKECPVCGELIDETLMVCPVCGEDITPQTNSEHAPESMVEEPEPVQEPKQEPVVIPQPEPIQEPKPIVAPQPEIVPKAEPEPKTRPVPPTVSKVAPQISVPEEPQKEIPVSSSKKTSPLLYVIIALLVIIIALLVIFLLRNQKSETEDKPVISQTEVVEEKPLTVPELLDSIAKMLPSEGQLIARFPDEARHCLYYLTDKKLYCYDAEKNMSDPIPVMREGFEVDVISAQLLEDGSTILLKVEDIAGKVSNYKLDTNTKNVMEVAVQKSIEKKEPVKATKPSVKKDPKPQTKREVKKREPVEEPEPPAKSTGFRLERVDKIPHSN